MTDVTTDQAADAVPDDPSEDLPEQMRVRRLKLDRMRELGLDPYRLGYPRTTGLADLRAAYTDLEPDVATGDTVGVTGRVLLSRVGGKLCFATLRDGTGDVQVMLSLDRLGEESLALWKEPVDRGDHVGVTGEVITSRRGELSVLADSWAITAKSLRPLPDKHHGLNPEQRVRMRYVDLIVNPDARRMLTIRSNAVRSVRDSLNARDYVEVETPMLQVVHGGANARPFRTHINAYNMDLFLRIAPELFLKRLAVGGVERVFEINRNFRNEGVDASHNPEFTMLEAYQAYGDYDQMQTMTRELIQEAAVAAFGSTVVTHVDGTQKDLGGMWRSVTVYGGLSEKLGEPLSPDTDLSELIRLCERAEISLDPSWGRGQIVLEMYEHLLESQTLEPTFYRDFPTDVSPLTRQHRDDPRLAERWDLVAYGKEIGTAYSELVDPVEQRRRLTEQSLLAAGGDAEAMSVDEDFLRALEYA